MLSIITNGMYITGNVYLKLSVAAWWSTVAYKTYAKYPYYEPVLLQSKVQTWNPHFSEELEVVRGDDCSCCNKRKIWTCTVLTKWVGVRVMTIKVSTLKNGCAVRDVMTIRPNTLSVSWYEGVYHKVSVETKWVSSPWQVYMKVSVVVAKRPLWRKW